MRVIVVVMMKVAQIRGSMMRVRASLSMMRVVLTVVVASMLHVLQGKTHKTKV